jgi:hypothetical protein
MGSYGTMFKTVPETTQSFANRMTCFKIPGAKEAPVVAQGILPDLSNYKVWTANLIPKDRDMVFSLAVYYGLSVSKQDLNDLHVCLQCREQKEQLHFDCGQNY